MSEENELKRSRSAWEDSEEEVVEPEAGGEEHGDVDVREYGVPLPAAFLNENLWLNTRPDSIFVKEVKGQEAGGKRRAKKAKYFVVNEQGQTMVRRTLPAQVGFCSLVYGNYDKRWKQGSTLKYNEAKYSYSSFHELLPADIAERLWPGSTAADWQLLYEREEAAIRGCTNRVLELIIRNGYEICKTGQTAAWENALQMLQSYSKNRRQLKKMRADSPEFRANEEALQCAVKAFCTTAHWPGKPGEKDNGKWHVRASKKVWTPDAEKVKEMSDILDAVGHLKNYDFQPNKTETDETGKSLSVIQRAKLNGYDYHHPVVTDMEGELIFERGCTVEPMMTGDVGSAYMFMNPFEMGGNQVSYGISMTFEELCKIAVGDRRGVAPLEQRPRKFDLGAKMPDARRVTAVKNETLPVSYDAGACCDFDSTEAFEEDA